MNKRDLCRFRAFIGNKMYYNVESPNTTELGDKDIGSPVPFDEIFLYPDSVVMQCSGLRDSKGELIYEGDVVRITQGKSIRDFLVTYYYDRTHGLGFKLHEIDKEDNNLDHWNYCFVIARGEKVDIIGNIYENEEYKHIQETLNEYVGEYQEDWLFPIRKDADKRGQQ